MYHEKKTVMGEGQGYRMLESKTDLLAVSHNHVPYSSRSRVAFARTYNTRDTLGLWVCEGDIRSKEAIIVLTQKT